LPEKPGDVIYDDKNNLKNEFTTADSARQLALDAMVLFSDGKITKDDLKAKTAPLKASTKDMKDKIKAMKTATALEKQQVKK